MMSISSSRSTGSVSKPSLQSTQKIAKDATGWTFATYETPAGT